MDLFPVKAQFLSGEEVILRLETGGDFPCAAQVTVSCLNKIILQKTVQVISENGSISLGRFDTDFGGYGVDAVVSTSTDRTILRTAFDVADNPRRSLRYGFLSDFTEQDDENGAVDWLCKCHINMVQYYDWSYRHDQLVAAQDHYQDMMGKNICKQTVKNKICQGHERGMLAIAYGAVYAASRPFFDCHRDWAFFNSNQKPFVFIDVFYLMNIQNGSPWRQHLIGQYLAAMEEMGFDGIHMDTYGFPKTAYSHLGEQPELVRLDEELPSLIRQTRRALTAAGKTPYLIFNNVGNWPVYSTADAPQDAVYIEVWSPYERYSHITQLIHEAKMLAGSEKPIILAAYLKPFREEKRESAMASAQILTAAIVSNGAYHLLLGENKAVLTQGYYSDYTALTDENANVLRRYYDFLIRYLNLFYDPELQNVSMTHMGWDNYEYQCCSHSVSAYGEAGKLWVILREKETRKCLFFINLCGCADDFWNTGKEKPVPQRDVHWHVQVDLPVKGICMASPDLPEARALPFWYTSSDKGRFADFMVPEVSLWTAVWLDF